MRPLHAVPLDRKQGTATQHANMQLATYSVGGPLQNPGVLSPEQCCDHGGKWVQARFERKVANACMHAMSTWPISRWHRYKHLHHRADRRARRGDAPRSSPDGGVRPATPSPTVGGVSRRKGELVCVCMRRTPVPHRCAWHSNTNTNAHGSADGSSSSCVMCSTRRPAGATVHDDDERSAARVSVTVRVRVCARLPPSAIGVRRRRMPVGEGGAQGGG